MVILTRDAQDSLLTVREAAALLRVHPTWLYRRVESGELRALRLGHGPKSPVRIDPADLVDVVVPSSPVERGVTVPSSDGGAPRGSA